MRSHTTVSSLLVLFTILGFAEVARSQTPTANYPGPAARENNRSMDDYDRTINRMKNDAKAVNERRRNLFPQINEDFQRIQVIHNEIVRMLQPDKSLNYDRLAELTDDMKKRSVRLRENLALPEPEKTKAQTTHSEAIDDSQLKKVIGDLHDLVVSFVANPIFKNLGVVDAKIIYAARENLEDIINTSGEIKREAKILSKSGGK
jgi:hypothetical protein